MRTLDSVTLPKGELRALSVKINLMEGLPCRWDYKDYKTLTPGTWGDLRPLSVSFQFRASGKERSWNFTATLDRLGDLVWGDKMFLIGDHFFFLDSDSDDDHLELVAMAPYKGSNIDAESAGLLSNWVGKLEDKLRKADEEERKMKEGREMRRLKKEAEREEKKKKMQDNERVRSEEKRKEKEANVDSNLRRRCREGNEAFMADNWQR